MADDRKPRNPLDMLYQIVGDLWPHDYVPKPSEPEEPAPAPTAAPAAKPEAKPEETATDALYAVPAPPPEPAAPPFEEYWRRADERVEWTEVLTRRHSPDGLTDPSIWAFLHERAERVLSGDTAAYGEILQRIDPLSDLKPYAASVTVSAPDSDRAEVRFEARGDRVTDSVGERRLLAGLALRCARDVLALLPVNEVRVEGSVPDGASLCVTYQRDPLRKARFGFIDPVAFAEEMGGEVSGEE